MATKMKVFKGRFYSKRKQTFKKVVLVYTVFNRDKTFLLVFCFQCIFKTSAYCFLFCSIDGSNYSMTETRTLCLFIVRVVLIC